MKDEGLRDDNNIAACHEIDLQFMSGCDRKMLPTTMYLLDQGCLNVVEMVLNRKMRKRTHCVMNDGKRCCIEYLVP